MRILKIFPICDNPFRANYEINYGVWDHIEGDEQRIETFGANLDDYDVVFLPMVKRWRDHRELLDTIKRHKIKKVLFDNDSCYRSFANEFYEGIDYIFYRGADMDGMLPTSGSMLLWSVNHDKFTPVYGGEGVSFLGSVSSDYPLRQEIDEIIEHSLHNVGDYIEALQNSAGSIHTNSLISPVVRAKVLEFAACGTNIISNRCDNMGDYFPDDLVTYFDTIDELEEIVKGFKPDIVKQWRLRAIVEEKHTHVIRAKQILEKI